MSESFEHRAYIATLYDIYGSLLTKRQQEIFLDVYEADLSFSEIADNKGISKAAVADSIKRTCNLLEHYEENLKIYGKSLSREKLYKQLALNSLSVDDFLKQIREID